MCTLSIRIVDAERNASAPFASVVNPPSENTAMAGEYTTSNAALLGFGDLVEAARG